MSVQNQLSKHVHKKFIIVVGKNKIKEKTKLNLRVY